MKALRTVSLLVVLVAPLQHATAQTVLDFTNTGGATFGHFNSVTQSFDGGVPYGGFHFAGVGAFSDGHLLGYGDGFSTYMHSPIAFTFLSALFKSQKGFQNPVCVFGYTATDRISSVGGCGIGGFGASYSALFTVDETSYTQQFFGWQDVTTLAFSSMGGRDPVDPFPDFNFFVDDITMTVTPEPASLALLSTGLVGVVGLRRWRKTRVTGHA